MTTHLLKHTFEIATLLILCSCAVSHSNKALVVQRGIVMEDQQQKMQQIDMILLKQKQQLDQEYQRLLREQQETKKNQAKQNKNNLYGIIPNPDIKEQIKRCGQAKDDSPCVLYLMNNYKNDKLVEDFFDTAKTMMSHRKVSKDQIMKANSEYAHIRISPGYFAEIKVPALQIE